MDKEEVAPLLPPAPEGSLARRVLGRIPSVNLGSPLCWCKVTDAAVLLVACGIAGCIFISIRPSSTSMCKAHSSQGTLRMLLYAVLQVAPLCLMGVSLYASRMHREAVGNQQPAILAFVQALIGVAVCEWLCVCLASVAPGAVLAVGTVIAVAAALFTAHVSRRGEMI